MPAPTEILKKASMHHQAGRLDQATLLYKQLLAKNPKQADIYLRLGDIYQRQAKFTEAISYFNKANMLAPGNPQVAFGMACCYHQFGRHAEALTWYEATLELAPDHGVAHNNLGSLLREAGRFEDAIQHFQAALQYHPTPQSVWHNLGNLYLEADRLDEAEQAYRECLALMPDSADAYFGLGRVLQRRGQPEDSRAAFQKAAELSPKESRYAYQLALSCKRQDKLDDARTWFQQAITLSPNYAEAHMGLAMVHFCNGDFAQAWPEYEWRLKLDTHRGVRLNTDKPVWQGEPLDGKIIAIHMEQGFGDAMQFVRFLPMVKAKNPAGIMLIVADELQRLFEMSKLPVDRYIGVGQGRLPGFDYHIPLLSIPGALKLRLPDIPATVPYLQPSATMQTMWSHQIPRTSRKQIGLVWTGRSTHPYNHQRSVPVELFAELTQLPGTRWANLQKEQPAPELPGEWFEIYSNMTDFADTATMIHCLDLVITIDTSVAHLAGALGKPVWLLLDTDPDWRWFQNRDDSPWYPTMRIFRQPKPGDWQSVIAAVKQTLQA